MHSITDRRRRTPIPAIPANRATFEEGWITLLGNGPGFHDCPLCRELGTQPETAEAAEGAGAGEAPETIVGFRRESLPELVRAGWLDGLLELVGRNATVRVMGRDMEAEPVEVLSMETFLARLGYE